MRMYGETSLSAIPSTKRTREGMNAAKREHSEMITYICQADNCGKEVTISLAKVKKMEGKACRAKFCWDCHVAGEKEMQQAMINLARRKGLIK